jgi:hypothetical protein
MVLYHLTAKLNVHSQPVSIVTPRLILVKRFEQLLPPQSNQRRKYAFYGMPRFFVLFARAGDISKHAIVVSGKGLLAPHSIQPLSVCPRLLMKF